MSHEAAVTFCCGNCPFRLPIPTSPSAGSSGAGSSRQLILAWPVPRNIVKALVSAQFEAISTYPPVDDGNCEIYSGVWEVS